MIKIKKVKIYHLEYPLKDFVIASFGLMKSRPALLIEIKDYNNNSGLGEIWSNFPADGASYKFNLFKNIFIDKLIDVNFNDPSDVYKIYKSIKTIFVQSADLGSYDSIISAINSAIWDLFAKNKQTPLNKFLNKKSSNEINTYASGINSNDAINTINKARESGFNAFKIKIGLNINLDFKLINKIFKFKLPNEKIMLDVNQGWDRKYALIYLRKIKKYQIYWIEEPISALSSDMEYLKLVNSSPANIALGENIYNEKTFDLFIKNKNLNFIQPDISKYGGISFPIKYMNTRYKNKVFLHFLGSGVGYISSAHVMSAINSNGLLETDFNKNPLRDLIFTEPIKVTDGKIKLNSKPGIGFNLSKNTLKKYLIKQFVK